MINNAASQLKDKATVYDILVPIRETLLTIFMVIWILPLSRFRFWMYSGSIMANTCISRQIITGRQTALTTPTRS